MNFQETFRTIFEPELISELEGKSSFQTYKEGEVIYDIGQIVRLIPLVLKGTLKVIRIDEEGNELLLYYVNPFETCALTFTCCMQNQPSQIKAVADEYLEIIGIPVSVMDIWLMKYPTWKNYVMQTIRNRFNELLKTIDQIAFQKLDERLAHYLNEKTKKTGSLLVNLSHEQIAKDLATSRVVISRLLKKLENEKKLLLFRNQIKLLKEL